MTSIFLMAATKVFQSIFEIVHSFFWFTFLNRKLIYVLEQTFLKKNCMQNLIFCVYNVVLDILILDFFLFSW